MFARQLGRSFLQSKFSNVVIPVRKYAVVNFPTTSLTAPLEQLIHRTQSSIIQGFSNLWSPFADGLLLLKRTFQPSLIRMKRKHGFLARLKSRNGKKILNRRRAKGRARLSN